MPGEAYFMAFGGLGLSLAGFAGLIAALNPTGAASRAVSAYRLRAIVFLGLNLTFVGFGVVAAFTITNDVSLSVRLATVAMLIPLGRGLLIDTRPGPVWDDERQRRFSIGLLAVIVALTLGNLIVAGVGYLQGLMLLGLIGPFTIFYSTIRDATGGPTTTVSAPPSSGEPGSE